MANLTFRNSPIKPLSIIKLKNAHAQLTAYTAQMSAMRKTVSRWRAGLLVVLAIDAAIALYFAKYR